ncbi:MAG: hypothetical protein AAFP90_07310 [Planctomycetota bacterium]
MFPFPRTIATITLAALLFGNAAGWVHVGHHHAGGCCDASATEAAECRSSGCCGDDCPFDHGAKEIRDQRLAEKRAAGAATTLPGIGNDASPPLGRHHSDHCSICQSFYMTSNGMPASASLSFASADLALPYYPRDAESHGDFLLANCISPRGPPHA